MKIVRICGYFILAFILLFFGLPNIFNAREHNAFSNEVRIENAQKHLVRETLGDSTEIVLATFFDRGPIVQYLFGHHYRDIWNKKIKLPVLNFDKIDSGVFFTELGGGEQTFSIELQAENGKVYTLRSVMKDQSRTLSKWLRASAIRPLFRDQACALNPFGALVAADLSDAAGLMHTNPAMYLVPYDERIPAEIRNNIGGRVMLLEHEADEGWGGSEYYHNAKNVIDSDDLIALLEENKVKIDASSFLKARLFDLIICDWDRHFGQWAWAVHNAIAKPIALDRDMAFYQFEDGLINKVALMVNNKMQSYTKDYKDVRGMLNNSIELDRLILEDMPYETYQRQIETLQHELSDSIIAKAFQRYPSEVFSQYGHQHIAILQSRRDQLAKAARAFYDRINNESSD